MGSIDFTINTFCGAYYYRLVSLITTHDGLRLTIILSRTGLSLKHDDSDWRKKWPRFDAIIARYNVNLQQ